MKQLSRRHFLKSSGLAASCIAISTAITGCATDTTSTKLSNIEFKHGVASGDPSSSAVIIWTRVQPIEKINTAQLAWELASDRDFTQVFRTGIVTTQRNQDFTVKVDVQQLKPATVYYYRFIGANNTSQTGRTLTLPVNNVEQIKLVVVSCSNYPAGYFNAYHHAAELEDIDAVLHLGDYIYEYPMGGYATEKAAEIGRALAPDNTEETISLDDYRKRYAIYRTDKGLQALHAAAPFIAVWDDHEVSNDTYKNGAENHNESEGDFFDRRAAAIQAYYEWLPIRPPFGEQNPEIYRSFNFGNLLSLHMLDTRVIGRDKQLSYNDYRDSVTKQINIKQFLQDLNQPQRTLLGAEQKSWLQKTVSQSSSRWQILGQQVLMAKMLIPVEAFAGGDITNAPARIAALKSLKDTLDAGGSLTPQQQQRLASVMPYNLDAWDGYPKEREDLYALFSDQNKRLVVLAGDTHNAWHSELKNKEGNIVGVEFATPGISSPGMESYLKLTTNNAQLVAENLSSLIAELEYCNLHQRGYMLVTITPEVATAKWHFIDNILSDEYQVIDTHQASYQA
jgi:alkaline phosphatase D